MEFKNKIKFFNKNTIKILKKCCYYYKIIILLDKRGKRKMSYSKTVDQKWQKKWKEQGFNNFKRH